MPASTSARCEESISGKPIAATRSAPQIAGRVPKRVTALPARSVVAMEGKKTKYTNPRSIRPSDSGGRDITKLTEAEDPVKPNRRQKTVAEAARVGGLGHG